MASIVTKLVKDGNSVAIRIPKTALKLSGLGDVVDMEVLDGKIILSAPAAPRSDWAASIADVLASNPTSLLVDPDLLAWDVTVGDGLDGRY